MQTSVIKVVCYLLLWVDENVHKTQLGNIHDIQTSSPVAEQRQ